MATTAMGLRVQEDTYKQVCKLAKSQNRSQGNILQMMVTEQLKRVEASGFDAIFYKPGEETND